MLVRGNCAHSKRQSKEKGHQVLLKTIHEEFSTTATDLSKRQTTLWSTRTSPRSFLRGAQSIGKCFVCGKLTNVNLKILLVNF